MENKTVSILGVIDTALTTVKTAYGKLDNKLSNLSLAEKVLIGIIWGIVALVAIFPEAFWALTSVALTAVLTRIAIRKWKAKKAASDKTTEEVAAE